MKTLVFDLWGDWAHFKKFYTTASPLSFHFPPVTALKGLIGAILGLSKNPSDSRFYGRELQGLRCAVQLVNPVKTFRMGYNWIETKKAKYLSRIPSEKGRYQTIIETIKDPFYRIFVAFPENGELYSQLRHQLERHQTVFTPYLGISEHLANFRFVGEREAENVPAEEIIPLHSVIPIEEILRNGRPAVQIREGMAYQRDRIPVEMNSERMVTRYASVIYEMNGKAIDVQPQKYWRLNDGTHIYFF